MSDYDPNYVETKAFYRIGVKTVIINGKDEVLLLRRSDKTPNAGTLDLPGGSVDEDESPQTAAIRETLEETGITITDPHIVSSVLFNGHHDPWVILGFSVRVDSDDVELSWEHDDYSWVPINEIESTGLLDIYTDIVYAYRKLL